MNEQQRQTSPSEATQGVQAEQDAQVSSPNPLVAELATMVTVATENDSYHAVLTVSPDLSVLKDHFEHQPILPGVCMVQVALMGASCVTGGGNGEHTHAPSLSLISVKNAKMVHPIFPGNVVDFHGQVKQLEDGSWQIKTKLTMGETRVAELSLIAR